MDVSFAWSYSSSNPFGLPIKAIPKILYSNFSDLMAAVYWSTSSLIGTGCSSKTPMKCKGLPGDCGEDTRGSFSTDHVVPQV